MHRRSLSTHTSNERGEKGLSETEKTGGGMGGGTGSNFTLKILANFQIVEKI